MKPDGGRLPDIAAGERAEPETPNGGLSSMIDEILRRHHRYMREETPRIRELIGRCAYGSGTSADAVSALARFFDNLSDDMEAHLSREEDELFPLLRAAEKGGNREPVGPLLRKVRAEHERAGDALTRMHVALARELLPEAGRADIDELRRRLSEYGEDLRAHLRAEDVLLARASTLEGRA